MTYFRMSFVNAHLLVSTLTVVAGDYRYHQLTVGQEGILHFNNATLHQHYGQTALFTPIFAKILNHMQSMADLASVLVLKDRRFCSDETLDFLNNLNTVETNFTAWQLSMSNLQKHCARNRRGRLTPVKGLKKKELDALNRARLEAKRVSCKPRAVQAELPPSPIGTLYYPHCVTVKRCGGCCNSVLLECKPVDIAIVKKRVVVFKESSQYKVTETFAVEQHKSCKCGCKTLASDCNKMQVYDEDYCECKCRNESEIETCEHPKVWVSKLCSCVCPKSLPCSTGTYIDPDSCKCIS